jgi:ribosomal protein S27AE
LRGPGSKSVSEALGRNPKSVKELMEIYKEVHEKDLVKSENPIICWKCLSTTYLANDEDDQICSRCGSMNLSSVHLLVDEPCPVCELGTFCMEITR